MLIPTSETPLRSASTSRILAALHDVRLDVFKVFLLSLGAAVALDATIALRTERSDVAATLVADITFTGTVSGRDVLLINEQNLRIRGHVEVEMSGSPDELLVAGDVQITNSRYVRRLTLLPDLTVRGGAASTVSGALRLLPIDSANSAVASGPPSIILTGGLPRKVTLWYRKHIASSLKSRSFTGRVAWCTERSISGSRRSSRRSPLNRRSEQAS